MQALLLMRHARATPEDDGDLTDLGRQQAAVIAEQLIVNNLVPDVVLHSPLRRAFQTASIIAERLNGEFPAKDIKVIPTESLACDRPPTPALRDIEEKRKACGTILAVTHMPNVEDISDCLGQSVREPRNATCLVYEEAPNEPAGGGQLAKTCEAVTSIVFVFQIIESPRSKSKEFYFV